MAAGKKNILISRGATFIFAFTYKNKSTGLPVDLTGYSAKSQGRDLEGVLLTGFDCSTTNGKIVLGGPAGTVSMEVDKTDTADMDPDEGVWDFFLIDPDDKAFKIVKGKVEIETSVTQGA